MAATGALVTLFLVLVPGVLALPSSSPLLDPRCTSGAPAIKDANTVTVKFRADDQCCSSSSGTITMGNLDMCHSTGGEDMRSWQQAVGANMFGRGINIWFYTDGNCMDNGKFNHLHNSADCDTLAGGTETFQSFLISARPTGGE